jgi:hypothetical protein
MVSVPDPKPIVLSGEEQALLERIDFDQARAGPSQVVQRSGDAALQLMYLFLAAGRYHKSNPIPHRPRPQHRRARQVRKAV